MSNPNRAFAAARNRKTVVAREQPCANRTEAEAIADAARKSGETVRITSYKIGPRNKPITKFVVRWYEAA